MMPSLSFHPECWSLALDGRHCGTYSLFAELCIEGKQRRYIGERAPPYEVNAGWFEGSGWYLSGGTLPLTRQRFDAFPSKQASIN